MAISRKINQNRATKCRSTSSTGKTIKKCRKNSFAKKCVATCEKIRAKKTRIAKSDNQAKICAKPEKCIIQSDINATTPVTRSCSPRNRSATTKKITGMSRKRTTTPDKRVCTSRKRAFAVTKRVSNSRIRISTPVKLSCNLKNRTTTPTKRLCTSRKRAFAVTKRTSHSGTRAFKRSSNSKIERTTTPKRIYKNNNSLDIKLINKEKCVKHISSEKNKSTTRKCLHKKITKKKNKSGFEEIKGVGPKFIQKLCKLNIRTLKNLQGRAECTTKRIFKRWLSTELCATPVQIIGITNMMTFIKPVEPTIMDIVMTEESDNVETLSKVPELCKEIGIELENKMEKEMEQTNKGGFFSGIFGNKQVTIEPMEVDEEIKKEGDDAKKEEVKA